MPRSCRETAENSYIFMIYGFLAVYVYLDTVLGNAASCLKRGLMITSIVLVFGRLGLGDKHRSRHLPLTRPASLAKLEAFKLTFLLQEFAIHDVRM